MIQRPRNRQGRSQPQQAGRGGSGRGRGSGSHSAPASSSGGGIPNIRQVVPGASVSIVLKIDQPTGRQVQGTVADVLTSGNHPRGIKVRLVDGRVGRVQRMVTEAEARAASEGLSNLGRKGEASIGGRIDGRYRDVREEDSGSSVPPARQTLADFLPPGHPLLQEEPQGEVHEYGTARTESFEPLSLKSAIHTCPVCEQFEGDELAVAHHVNSHFD